LPGSRCADRHHLRLLRRAFLNRDQPGPKRDQPGKRGGQPFAAAN